MKPLFLAPWVFKCMEQPIVMAVNLWGGTFEVWALWVMLNKHVLSQGHFLENVYVGWFKNMTCTFKNKSSE